MMGAMIGVLWTYDGWINTASLAEEIREPNRNIPRACIGGMLILIAVYLGMTLVYHLVLPMDQVAWAARRRARPKWSRRSSAATCWANRGWRRSPWS